MEYNVDYTQMAVSIGDIQKNLMDMYRTMNQVSDNFKTVIYNKQNWNSPTSEFGSQQTSHLYQGVSDMYMMNSDILKFTTSIQNNMSEVISMLNGMWS